jgi:hypothetical protein
VEKLDKSARVGQMPEDLLAITDTCYETSPTLTFVDRRIYYLRCPVDHSSRQVYGKLLSAGLSVACAFEARVTHRSCWKHLRLWLSLYGGQSQIERAIEPRAG